jgi:hypothetical protein
MGGAAYLFSREKFNLLEPNPSPSPTSTTGPVPAAASNPTALALQPNQSDTIQPTEVKAVATVPDGTINQKRAGETYQAVVKNFAIPGQSLFIEGINPKDDKYAAYLWPFSSVPAAVAALCYMKEIGPQYAPELERVLLGLDAYYDAGNNPPAWQSYIPAQGGGERYYDDNEWIGLIYLDAYRLLKKDGYLAKAIEAFNYSVSGWDEEMGGGIYWKEFRSKFDNKTKNTCSNAPAAVMALGIYQETGKDEYMQWAQKILDWMKRLKSTDDGVYWDHIDKDGFINQNKYTYNTGSMIHANALLYAILKDPQYLNEARSLAEAAYQYFPRDYGTGIALYFGDSWFTTVLMRGYMALYNIDPSKERKYVDHMRQNLDYAWENARDANGLFTRNWMGPAMEKMPKKLIDQAAMVELYAWASQFDS